MAPFLDAISQQGYRMLLQRLFGFYQPLEARMVALPEWRCGSPEIERRQKSHLLISDLEHLGVGPEERRCLPQCERLPVVNVITQALGCLYVLEGATLGGQIILRHLRQHLGVDAGRGSSFFASYGENVGPMWSAFGQFVNNRCTSLKDQGVLVRAARDTFDTMSGWLFAAEPETRKIGVRA